LQLIRFVAITIFELDRHLSDETISRKEISEKMSPQEIAKMSQQQIAKMSPQEIAKMSQQQIAKMSPQEIAIVRLLSDLLAGMLNAFLLPVYTVKQVG
jgi:hypothetical protein